MAETTLFVQEAKSAPAIQSLESTLIDIAGVERALADVEGGKVKIQFDETKVSEERIVLTLQEHGFHIHSQE
ncbi:heavy-metal-associated domain-containing protein [Ectobacillus panaciterrae]|uniref:heavy-metal-associated domain-containing protein n=1 Tax=Ectobacillus panaciterrae TaxID=363872 RepID=UPI0004297322|nr:hypothetical protein [Ectobacillus panaciterrae]